MRTRFNRILPFFLLSLLTIALVLLFWDAIAPSPAPPPYIPAPISTTATIIPNSPTSIAIAPVATRTATRPPIPLSDLPIFDTHAHYSRNSWSEYSPQDIINKLVSANVARALISSSPDDGTRRLQALDPVRIAAGLRPYHDEVGINNWETSEKTLPYLDERIDAPFYVALGEIHVHVDNVESPIFQSAIRRALDRDLVLHIHSDAETIRAVFEIAPDAKILWAHAGLIEAPETVSATLDDYPSLWTDISIREYSIAPNGVLDEAWRDLFLKHPDRITIGSDTWIPERWTSYENIIASDRIWLNQLPLNIAENIAYRNAVKLFGAGDVSEFQE